MEDRVRQLTMYDLNKKRNEVDVNSINQSKSSRHSGSYDDEIKQVFIYVNNLITKLSIEKDWLENYSKYLL